MSETIPPKGMAITQYPPLVKTAAISRMVDLAKVILDLEVSIAESKAQVEKLFVPESMFFLGQFGPDPFTDIISKHFKSPTGQARSLNNTQIRTLSVEISKKAGPSLLVYKNDKIVIILKRDT